MFNKEFFKSKQRILLWLLNSRLTRHWFRYALRIDCKEKINQITPNSYTYGGYLTLENGKLKANFKTDFRTHNKYSKRLFYAFKPLWQLCHCWDMLTKFNPAWNLGFDTTSTFYPDSNPETTSVDGYAGSYGDGSWASARADDGAVRGVAYPSADPTYPMYLSIKANNSIDLIARAYFLFDTTAIPNYTETTISGATLSLKGTGKDNTGNVLNNPDVNIYAGTPQSNTNLVGTDYNITRFGSTAFSTTINYATWSASAYNDFALNASGISNITKGGVSKFATRDVTHDIGNVDLNRGTFPAASYFQCNSADVAGTSSDPKLVVLWSIIITPANATITLSGQVPTVAATITITPSNATITLTGQIPTITKTGGYSYGDRHSSSWNFQSKS